MFKISLFLVLAISVSCSLVSKKKESNERSPQSVNEYSPELLKLYNQAWPLLEELKSWRANAEATFSRIAENKKKNEPITSEENKSLHSEGKKYLALRNKARDIVNKYLYVVKNYQQTKLSVVDPTTEKLEGSNKIAILNPKDKVGKDTLLGFRISLSMALALYDNYLVGIYPYYKMDFTRNKLVYDAENKQALDEITESFFSAEQRTLMAKAINIYHADFQVRRQYELPTHEFEKNLDSVIVNSGFYNYLLKTGDSSDPWDSSFKRKITRLKDEIGFVKRASTFLLRGIFGNVVGAKKSDNRDGYMRNLKTEEKEKIFKALRPFDILLEKTSFRSTDAFIPGYYGHVAIWLGTKEQLIEEGLWSYIPAAIQSQIEKGQVILEALRYNDRIKAVAKLFNGVQLNTLEHFLDIDDLLVLRNNDEYSKELKVRYIKNAVKQVGKPYDFNFDVESDQRIVCAELIFVVFDNLKWKTEKTLGRFTISPDHILEKAMPGKNFHPILLYKNGREVRGTLQIELLRLLKKEYVMLQHQMESLLKTSMDPQEVVLLTSGIGSLYKRVNMIRSAKDSIDLEYFIYQTEDDFSARMITQELMLKAQQKAASDPSKNIRVRILVDSSFTVFKLDKTYATALRDKGIQVRYYNVAPLTDFMKSNSRNHRKTIIVDGKEVITGGRNIGDDYFDLSRKYNFLDTDIYVKGSMATAFKDSFEAFWYSSISEDPEYYNPRSTNKKGQLVYTKKIESGMNMINISETDDQYAYLVQHMGKEMFEREYKGVCRHSTFVSDLPGAGPETRKTFPTIYGVVSQAKESLHIESPYFVITDKGTNIFKNLLGANKDFKLNILTNSLYSTDAFYTVAAFYPIVSQWTSKGVNMWIYKGEKPKYLSVPAYEKDALWGLHSKRAVIDGKITMIGTYNVDPRSTNLNNEMVFICHDNPELANRVIQDIQNRIKHSAQLGPDGKPIGEFDLYDNVGTGKKTLYYISEKLLEMFPSLHELL
ncbi:MAG: hypothetical protein HUU56_07500 [Bdellovibrionaceae bacterium]|nr:hypothetical protein [Pseudobdellovibrionaceae bacterium]